MYQETKAMADSRERNTMNLAKIAKALETLVELKRIEIELLKRQ